jgi:hypothetical protein
MSNIKTEIMGLKFKITDADFDTYWLHFWLEGWWTTKYVLLCVGGGGDEGSTCIKYDTHCTNTFEQFILVQIVVMNQNLYMQVHRGHYIHNFLGYRSMNESCLSWRVCVCMVFMWTHVQYDILQPCGLNVNKPQNCQLYHTTCHLWSLQQQLQFLLGVIHTIYGVAPKEVITVMSGEHVGQDHPHLKSSGNWFDRSRLPNTCRTSKITFAVYHPAGKMLCPHALHPEWLELLDFAVTAGATGLCIPTTFLVVADTTS